jgi:hypothetical protein
MPWRGTPLAVARAATLTGMRNTAMTKCIYLITAMTLATFGCSAAPGDAESLGSTEQEATYFADRDWPLTDGVVNIPYEIDPNIPTFAQQNFIPALNYIEDATGQRFQFLPRAGERQYLRFAAGAASLSHSAHCGIGNTGGLQQCTFRLPQVVGIAHLRDGSSTPLRVYFADGTMRATRLNDLQASSSGNVPVTFPTNPQTGEPYRAGDIAGIGWSGYMIVWYTNGYVSKGSETDLGSIKAPTRFTGYSYEQPIASGQSITVKLKLAAVTISPRGIAHAYWLDPRKTTVGQGPAIRHTQASSSTNLVGAAADDFLMNVPHSMSEDLVAMAFDEQAHLHSFFQEAGLRAEGSNTDYAQFGDASITTTPHAGFNTVLHELGHALGFHHEQQRPDRNDFVVGKATGGDWDIESSASVLGGYDFASIMQYDSTPGKLYRVDGSQFSKNYNAFSWRDLRALLVDHGLEDPESNPDAEARAAADLAAASDRAGRGQVYSVAAGRIYADIVAVDADGFGNTRAYYLHAPPSGSAAPTRVTTSNGTTYDLARHEVGRGDVAIQLPAVDGTQIDPYSIVGMAISDGSTLTWFKSDRGTCASHLYWSRGSFTVLDSLRSAACVALPAGYSPDQIREISRYRYGGVTRFLTVYDDGKFSVGVTNSLASVSGGTFELAPDPSLSLPNPAHILGFTLSGRNASFFLGCEDVNHTCQGDEYRVLTISDFVSHLPAQFQ